MIDYTLPLEQLPDPLPIEPLRGRPFDVSIAPPGSKSITCRAYVLAALAQGTSKIIRPLRADDTDTLLKALCALGARAEWVPGRSEDASEDVLITGVGGRFPRGGELYMGDGGAPTRFMIACACLAKEPVTIDASPRMRERPIAEGVEMLRALGATIEYVEEEGRLPVRVLPSAEFKGGTLAVGKTASSQFISAVMLIAPWLEGGLELECVREPTSAAYINLTMQVLGWNWQSMMQRVDTMSFSIPQEKLEAQECLIEPDASSAAYWIVAAAVTGSRVTIPHLPFGSQQADVYVAKHLEPEVWNWRTDSEWTRDVQWPLTDSSLSAGEYAGEYCPDGAVAIAIAMSRANGVATITGLHTLRHKETDRLAALAAELTKVGCEVETGEDWIRITPMAMVARRSTVDPRAESGAKGTHGRDARTTDAFATQTRVTVPSNPVIVETCNDHRMAMAFAILGLARPGISIRNPACVAKSYPTFWKDFAKLYEGVMKK